MFNARTLKERGGEMHFTNEDYQRGLGGDDIRTCTIEDKTNDKSLPNWARSYRIWFNGKLIGSYKTFAYLKINFVKLAKEWHLEEEEK
jgi:hypothetical protein